MRRTLGIGFQSAGGSRHHPYSPAFARPMRLAYAWSYPSSGARRRSACGDQGAWYGPAMRSYRLGCPDMGVSDVARPSCTPPIVVRTRSWASTARSSDASKATARSTDCRASIRSTDGASRHRPVSTFASSFLGRSPTTECSPAPSAKPRLSRPHGPPTGPPRPSAAAAAPSLRARPPSVLERYLNALPDAYAVAVEVRHPAFFADAEADLSAVLDASGAARGLMGHAGGPRKSASRRDHRRIAGPKTEGSVAEPPSMPASLSSASWGRTTYGPRPATSTSGPRSPPIGWAKAGRPYVFSPRAGRRLRAPIGARVSFLAATPVPRFGGTPRLAGRI